LGGELDRSDHDAELVVSAMTATSVNVSSNTSSEVAPIAITIRVAWTVGAATQRAISGGSAVASRERGQR
jgi:hypothetical protein